MTQIQILQLFFFTVQCVPHLTSGFSGSRTWGMLWQFLGDATAAGAPINLTVKQTQFSIHRVNTFLVNDLKVS